MKRSWMKIVEMEMHNLWLFSTSQCCSRSSPVMNHELVLPFPCKILHRSLWLAMNTSGSCNINEAMADISSTPLQCYPSGRSTFRCSMRRSNISNHTLHTTPEEAGNCADLHFHHKFVSTTQRTNGPLFYATMTPIKRQRLQKTDLRLIGTCGVSSERMGIWRL